MIYLERTLYFACVLPSLQLTVTDRGAKMVLDIVPFYTAYLEKTEPPYTCLQSFISSFSRLERTVQNKEKITQVDPVCHLSIR